MSTDKDSILIQPFTKPCRSKVEVPGSKSISNRALILSVMCGGKTQLKGLLESEDVDLMRQALSDLGIQIEKNETTCSIIGECGEISNKECSINVGNAGTIARFLTCLLASQKGGKYSLDGSPAMRKRPMAELLKCLTDLGCKIKYEGAEGCFPFTLHSNGINKSKIEIDASKSGQNISGILMQCPLLGTDVEIGFKQGTVSLPFIKMTLEMMRSFSENEYLNYELNEKSILIKKSNYRQENYAYNIEPDATAASYFLTLPQVVGGVVRIHQMKDVMLQGDIDFFKILNDLGANVYFDETGIVSEQGLPLSGGSFDFNDISDTFLTLAAISPILSSPLELYGIEHTRKQETDRVSAMAKELIKLGQVVIEKPDRLVIHPDLNKLKKAAFDMVSINTYNDHRFAMSFAILGCYDLFGDGRPWLKILNPGCCAKTFPGFFDHLDTTHQDSNG